MNNYPPQLPPPPPPPPPGGYNPFNPYSGYDQTVDYVPWLPGRQSPRFLPIVMIVAAILVCSCCAFFAGTIFGIELPGFLEPSAPPQRPAQDQPQDNPTPDGGFNWQITYADSGQAYLLDPTLKL